MNPDLSNIKPTKFVNGEPMWDEKDVAEMLNNSVQNQEYFKHRQRNVTDDMEQSSQVIDEMVQRINKSSERLVNQEKNLSEAAKKVSSQVRQHTDKLQGVASKLEKSANFDKLERQVEVLERVAEAMKVLAELESDGKFGRIVAALNSSK